MEKKIFKPVEVSFAYCGKKRMKRVSQIQKHPLSFYNISCTAKYKIKETSVQCSQCKTFLNKKNHELKRVKKIFCSNDCFKKT